MGLEVFREAVEQVSFSLLPFSEVLAGGLGHHLELYQGLGQDLGCGLGEPGPFHPNTYFLTIPDA